MHVDRSRLVHHWRIGACATCTTLRVRLDYVEAETIFDVPANGIYYANLVVTGVPVIPPTKADTAKLLP
jgi:hypothetical protein